MTEYWYRFNNYQQWVDEHSSETRVQCEHLPVRKVTPCGVWLGAVGKTGWFVLRSARKRYACPTKAEAWESFVARKKRQLRVLRAQAEHVEEALKFTLVDGEIVAPVVNWCGDTSPAPLMDLGK